MSRKATARLPRVRLGAAAVIPNGPFVALVPGEEAPLLPVAIPSGVKGAARIQVASLRLKDASGTGGSPVEVHPYTPAKAANWDRVVIADQGRLAQWRSAVAEIASGHAQAMLPDFLDLPAAEGLLVLQADGARIMVRNGLADGFAAEPALAIAMLTRSLAATPARAALWIGPPDPQVNDWIQEAGPRLCNDASDVTALGLSAPVRHEAGVDLLRDPGAEAERIRKALRPWAAPVILALLAVAVLAAHQFWLGQIARQDAQATRIQTEAILRETFLPTGPILDVRAQVSRALDAARRPAGPAKASDPIALFRSTVNALASAPEGTRVQEAGFTPESGLALDIQIPTFAAADALVDTFRNAGLSARLVDASSGETESVTARIVISGMEAPK